MDSSETTRLYAAAIALVSGLYSLFAMGGMTTDWPMAVLGVVVLVHGAVLLTPYAERLGSASGPLMILYAVLMLLNQAWMTTMSDGMMGDGMMGGMRQTTGMLWDPGMVALAVLMLASGLIMTVGDGDDAMSM